ncbi:MAG TPA: IS4 family transposase, partial [Oligoflexus sp.]|uniref:IS4 family transposase n=1 Tax=Oligoflexus sp. TaxID=1971216 RepID=UPI002D6C0F5D
RWNFVTNLPITCRQEAIQTIEWYKHRWKIENYFKIIKSGFKAEESRLRTADRIAKLISIFCILAWRVHWITYLGREGQHISPSIAFDRVEQKIISAYFKKEGKLSSLNDYVIHLARLGGYLGRAGDSPPGNIVIWRGLSRLSDLRDGFELNCG